MLTFLLDSVLGFPALVFRILWKLVIRLLLGLNWLVATWCGIWLWGISKEITNSFTYVYMYVFVCGWLYVCVYLHVYVYVFVCVYIYIYVCVCVYYVYIYIYIYIYINSTLWNEKEALISVGVADVRCVTVLRKLKYFQAQSQGNLIKLITVYVVMINISFTF